MSDKCSTPSWETFGSNHTSHDEEIDDEKAAEGTDDSDSVELNVQIPISSLYSKCIRKFDSLVTLCKNENLLELQELISRLQIWAGNNGAHRQQNDRLSLDHRLREVPELCQEVRDHFKEMNMVLEDAISIVSGEDLKDVPEDSYSSSNGSDTSLTSSQKAFIGVNDIHLVPDTNNRIGMVFQNIDNIIMSLFKFSITIQNPAHRDRTSRAIKIDMSFWYEIDLRRICDKFPRCLDERLLSGLARANTKRRQLFAYHKRHKDKIEHFKNPENATKTDQEPSVLHESTPNLGANSVAHDSSNKQPSLRTSKTEITNTTVSTIQPRIAKVTKSISVRSQRTNLLQESTSDAQDVLKIPPPPTASDDFTFPFICPYCYLFVQPRNIQDWEIHVLDDLRPYTCTFPDCTSPEILYDRYSIWKAHELETHRREWFCNFCKAISETKDDFTLHLQGQHSDLLGQMSLESLASICERVSTRNEECILCGNFTGDVYALQQHLAQHLRQLAIFTLPKTGFDQPDASEARSSIANIRIDDEIVSDNTQKEIIEMSEEEFELFHCVQITPPDSPPRHIPDPENSVFDEYLMRQIHNSFDSSNLGLTHGDTSSPHWVTKVFKGFPFSPTSLHHRRLSKCFEPSMSESRQNITPGSSVLLELSFDENNVKLSIYLHPHLSNSTRLLCRWIDRYYHPNYSCYGIEELHIKRIGSALHLSRFSGSYTQSIPWLVLFFKTWEEMVLSHDTLISLKARCPYESSINSDEYQLSGELVMFKAHIIDDGYKHFLAILEDKKTFSIRLQAAASEGELRKCPIWTAFVTHQSDSPTWLNRRSKHRIWLTDIHIYTFCDDYQESHQRNEKGEFEIYFLNVEAANRFEDFFLPPVESKVESAVNQYV